jgi:hypothetical protein
MTLPLSLTDEEAALVADAQFFRKQERISAKMTDPRLQAGLLPELSREAFRSILPIVMV